MVLATTMGVCGWNPPSSHLILLVTKYSLNIFSILTKSVSKNVHEQGRIQGALSALSALASALGPVSLRLVYQKTKDTSHPGSFFLLSSAFYFFAMICAIFLPKKKTDSIRYNSYVTIPNTNSNDGDSDDEISAEIS